jgi:hypothetical protein
MEATVKVEIDETVLLKIDWALKGALRLLRDECKEKGIVIKTPYITDCAIDDLSDAICRISEDVRKIKEG